MFLQNLQFGEVLAAAGHEEATVLDEIDLSMIQSTRHKKILRTSNLVSSVTVRLSSDQGRTCAGRTSRWGCRAEETCTDWWIMC